MFKIPTTYNGNSQTVKLNVFQYIYGYVRYKFRRMNLRLTEILHNATSQGYKSNVIKPLMGVAILFFLLTIIMAYMGQKDLAILSFWALISIAFVTLVAYYICLFKNPDLLRSEKYNLEKATIEKTAIKGDSTTDGKLLTPKMDYVQLESSKGFVEGGNDK